MQIRYSLRLPTDAATVPLVRGLCQDAMARVGASADDVDDVGLAITEACTNVVVHAAGGVHYSVDVEFAAHECHIQVSDAGAGFEVGARDGPAAGLTDEQGRGIALMKELMDDIEVVDSGGASGTIVRLHKSLDLAGASPLRWDAPAGNEN
jgi:serine/threonine-protein kinase RsbW